VTNRGVGCAVCLRVRIELTQDNQFMPHEQSSQLTEANKEI
jgi:hypothetical protein